MRGFDVGPHEAVYKKKKESEITPKFLASATTRMDLSLIEVGESVGRNGLRGIFGAKFWMI